MKKENLMQYVLLLLIGFIVVIGLINSFKTSRNLKAALDGIQEAKELVKESSTILKNQGLAIDSIKTTNNGVIKAMGTIESQNKFIRESIAWKFKQSNDDLDSIRVLIENMEEIKKPNK